MVIPEISKWSHTLNMNVQEIRRELYNLQEAQNTTNLYAVNRIRIYLFISLGTP